MTPRRTPWSLVLLLAACRSDPPPQLDPAVEVGIGHADSSGGCIALGRARADSGTPVTMVSVPSPQMSRAPAVARVRLLGIADEADARCPVGAEGHRYRTSGTTGAGLPGPAFALFGGADSIEVHGGRAWLRRSGGPRAELRMCTSMEGFHLTLWEGEALTGRRLFHRYVPLDYNVEPSCTPAEWGPDAR